MTAGLDPGQEWEYNFHFRSGACCLDFVATIGERWRRNFERLRRPSDLSRWFVKAGLAAARVRVTSADLEDARCLRSAIHGLARNAIDGTVPVVGDLEIVNEWAMQSRPRWVLDGLGSARLQPATSAREALSLVAADAVELFGGALSDRIRDCGAHDCGIIFVDRSRPGSRRWCSMRGCGGKAKSAAYRKRHNATH